MTIELFDMHSPLGPDDSREQDILEISKLWGSIRPDSLKASSDPETFRTLMSGLDYLVLRGENSQIIGAVSVLDCTRPPVKLAKVDSLAVSPEERRKGYGETLALAAVDHCIDRDYAVITTSAEPMAVGVFSAIGFEGYEVNSSGNTTMFLDL